MHPAYSVIIFTTMSGAGYGLAAVLGTGIIDPTSTAGWTGYLLALALIGTGLAASALHLGQPTRAWRALSQWRTSWLSREAVLAGATFVPLVTVAGAGFLGLALPVVAAIGGVLALATVFATAMIYASLKAVHQWATPLTPALYLAHSLAGGLVLAVVLAGWFGGAAAGNIQLPVVTLAVLAGAWMAKRAWWRRTDTDQSPSTAATATGLGGLGPVRLLDRPHTGDNYLTREMGFRVARKHSTKLRVIAVVLGYGLPAIALAGTLAPETLGAIILTLG
ncbi:MAG: dimethyl sulfoxide reductase anchor subunit family protein, partial [Alphaproteobacteria bacterium]